MEPYQELIHSYNEFNREANGGKSPTFYQNKSKTIKFTKLLIDAFVRHMNCPPDSVSFRYAANRDKKPDIQCDLTLALTGNGIPDPVYLTITLNIRPNDEDDTGGYLVYAGSGSAIVRDIESKDPEVSYDVVETCEFLGKILAGKLYELFPRK